MIQSGKALHPLPGRPDPEIAKRMRKRHGYELGEGLASGSMSDIYSATDSVVFQRVAIKLLSREYSGDAVRVGRFLAAGEGLRGLGSPHLVSVRKSHHDTAEGLAFIVMDHAEGKDAGQLVPAISGLPWRKLKPILSAACLALKAVHEAGIIHANVRPQKIMVDDGWTAKLLGSSLSVKGGPAEPGASGAPVYAAPEQLKKKETDRRTDVYSMGAVMYELITGAPPFPLDSRKPLNEAWAEAAIRILDEPPLPMGAARPGLSIPPELDALVIRCLSKDPALRFQTAAGLCRELQRLP